MSDHIDPSVVEYVIGEGTIKVSGSTIPKRAGKCAFFYLKNGKQPIDFFCIGANANQQAMKAMGVFLHIVSESYGEDLSVAFRPLRYKTMTNDIYTNEKKYKDCVVWRTVILEKSSP